MLVRLVNYRNTGNLKEYAVLYRVWRSKSRNRNVVSIAIRVDLLDKFDLKIDDYVVPFYDTTRNTLFIRKAMKGDKGRLKLYFDNRKNSSRAHIKFGYHNTLPLSNLDITYENVWKEDEFMGIKLEDE